MKKVKVSPTRNEIHSNVQTPYKYYMRKICNVNTKNRIFLHSSKNLGVTLQAEVMPIHRIGISLIQKHGVLHCTNIVYLLCTPFGKSGMYYIVPLSTLPTIRLLGRVTHAGFSCIPNFKLLQNIYKLIQRQTKLFQYLTISIIVERYA